MSNKKKYILQVDSVDRGMLLYCRVLHMRISLLLAAVRMAAGKTVPDSALLAGLVRQYPQLRFHIP